MTHDTYAKRLEVDKQIRRHTLIGRLTVSAAVDWLCDPTKPGNHDPLELAKALESIGLDFAVQREGGVRRLIYVANAIRLKCALVNFSVDALEYNPWLYTRGETLALGQYRDQLVRHDLRPFTGAGLSDAMHYVLEYRTETDGTVLEAAEWLRAAEERGDKYGGGLRDEYNARLRRLQLLGLSVMHGSIIVLHPGRLAVAMPAMRSVHMLMKEHYTFDVAKSPHVHTYLELVK